MLCRYVLKLVQELEAATAGTFTAPSDRDRAKSVLADLQKTAGDFRAMAGKALDAVAAGIVPRLRWGSSGLRGNDLSEHIKFADCMTSKLAGLQKQAGNCKGHGRQGAGRCGCWHRAQAQVGLS